MKFTGRRCGLVVALTIVMAGGAVRDASSQEGVVVSPELDNTRAAQSALKYWTPERMRAAQPMPTPGVATDSTARKAAIPASPLPSGPRGVAYGWKPGPAPAVQKVRIFNDAAVPAQEMAAPLYFGTAPTNPKDGPYGPFSREGMQGTYLNYPRTLHGRYFFTLNGSNYSCSATVIGGSTIATAGHCVSDGAGTWATNRLFCPSYYNGGPGGAGMPNPARGCWSGVMSGTSTAWHTAADPDSDYACVVLATTGTVFANKVSTLTGVSGRGWNWSNVPVTTFGYPAVAPFLGNTIQMTNSVMWYGWDGNGLGGQVSNVIGSDLNAGSSGGGWFIGWRHVNNEVADTDGNNITDPGGAGPFLVGINSHKRCEAGDCSSPPTTTSGIYWQEMTSPPFANTAAGGESEDVFAGCLAHANN